MTEYLNFETYISQFGFLTPQEIGRLRILYEDPRVDEVSYFNKLRQVEDNLKSTQNARDLVTELIAASEFLNVANLETIKFDENPDFYVQILNHDLAIEVKNFRYRTEDALDDVSLRKAVQNGKLVTYGNSVEVQLQIEEALAKKVQNYHGTETFFLYFWSHSPHHVEDIEIECAARTIFNDKRYSKLIGLFYNFSNRTVFVYPVRNQGKHVELFEMCFTSKVM